MNTKNNNDSEDKRCGAKTKKGTPCTRYPLRGRNRCKYHGGKSLRGPASGRFKHGLYSKVWNEEEAKIYAAHTNGDLTSMELAQEICGLTAARWMCVHRYAQQHPDDMVAVAAEAKALSEYRLAARGVLEVEAVHMPNDESKPTEINIIFSDDRNDDETS